MSDEACQHCGGELRFLEKDTSSGREYREYVCAKCGKLTTLGGDVALWQVLHDANQEAAAPTRWWAFWKR